MSLLVRVPVSGLQSYLPPSACAGVRRLRAPPPASPPHKRRLSFECLFVLGSGSGSSTSRSRRVCRRLGWAVQRRIGEIGVGVTGGISSTRSPVGRGRGCRAVLSLPGVPPASRSSVRTTHPVLVCRDIDSARLVAQAQTTTRNAAWLAAPSFAKSCAPQAVSRSIRIFGRPSFSLAPSGWLSPSPGRRSADVRVQLAP